jgi:hypothetical protein
LTGRESIPYLGASIVCTRGSSITSAMRRGSIPEMTVRYRSSRPRFLAVRLTLSSWLQDHPLTVALWRDLSAFRRRPGSHPEGPRFSPTGRGIRRGRRSAQDPSLRLRSSCTRDDAGTGLRACIQSEKLPDRQSGRVSSLQRAALVGQRVVIGLVSRWLSPGSSASGVGTGFEEMAVDPQGPVKGPGYEH